MSLLNTYEKTNITTFVKFKISEGIWIRIYTIRIIDTHFQNIGQLNLTTTCEKDRAHDTSPKL